MAQVGGDRKSIPECGNFFDVLCKICKVTKNRPNMPEHLPTDPEAAKIVSICKEELSPSQQEIIDKVVRLLIDLDHQLTGSLNAESNQCKNQSSIE